MASDWDDILKEIRALQVQAGEKPAQQTIDAVLALLGRMALHMELQRDPLPPWSTVDDLHMNMLQRRLDQSFDAINKKLDEMEQRLPEAP